MKTAPCDIAGFEEAVRVLRGGGIVAYPTETVYGLGVDPFNDDAVQRLRRAKGRDADAAILLIVADDAQLERCVSSVTDRARLFMEAFWPGPLSLLFPKSETLAPSLTAGAEKVCVRCPGLRDARRLCEAFGGPVTSTSANVSGGKPAASAAEIQLRDVELVLDGGELAASTPSTVYDPERDEVFREGAVKRGELAAIIRKARLDG